MIKREVPYKDFNGIDRKETVYFNLSETELIDMQMSKTGGLDVILRTIIDTNDQVQLYNIFKDLVLKAYGEKSEDGRRFIKSDELRHEFSQTEVYNKLWYGLATNADEASKFVNDLIPEHLSAEINK